MATEAEVDAQPTSLCQAMGLAPSVDKVISVFWNDGTRTTYTYAGTTPAGCLTETWTVSGNVVTVSSGGSAIAYECEVSSEELSMTRTQGGHTVVVRWQKVEEDAGLGTGGAESATPLGVMIMDSWQVESVAVNGQVAPVSAAFGWDPAVNRVVFVFHGYGTLTAYAYVGSSILETRQAMWGVSDTTMTIYWSDHIATLDCSVTESELTLSYDEGGNSVVVVCRKTD